MLQFVIAGLVLGGIYAIASAGLVITYTSSGILNFAFGAMAYFIARFYYYLHTQQNWSIPAAGAVSILIAAPVLGVLLYAVLFRFLRLSSPLTKVVATIGLSVALPSLATLIFGSAGHPAGTGPGPRTGAGCSTSSASPSRWTRSSSTSASWSSWWPGRWCSSTATSA